MPHAPSTSARRIWLRVSFWILFLAAAGVAAWQIWTRLDPLHNHPVIATWWLEHNHAQLASRHPARAARAWQELDHCFHIKWSAYDWIVWRVKEDFWKPEDPPIHFRLTRSGDRFTARPAGPPAECRTVNEALMAILHGERVGRVPFRGDWRQWWEANWTAYPNWRLPGKPAGPEAPRRGGRR